MGLKDKPDVAGIRQLSQNNNIDPGKIIHVGDTAGDIRMAKNFGSPCIGIGYGGYSAPEKVIAENPDAIIRGIDEIYQIPSKIEHLVKHRGR
jgi:phosphoglycolate phosphatase-like HAD superfamily hydrolase